ncbi:phosphotransferase family protein [Baekduia soli]|uniref:Phosphotransferase family protein n=1 Tax=Baekduia soli TaxID=496014 RepID=A0A5B8U3X6_9ACTN|nr:phosphotransferase family protein [Baekduia soli]QEC47776.1 phosphotransferase family protein [Baekduia soli]
MPDADGLGEALRAFLAERVGEPGLRLECLRRSVEGFSWETYVVGVAWDAGGAVRRRRLVVHREPAAGLLRPYRAATQFALRRAVEGIDGVPVPRTLWLDEHGEATGRPLYVVERVAGEVPTQWTSDRAFAGATQRAAVARELMRIAAALHAAPPAVAPPGLRGAQDPDPIAEVRHWHAIYTGEGLEPVPILDWGFAWLLAHADHVSGRRAVLHGDLRTGNYLLHDGRIAAVLDWEEAHVGDPVQDLAHCALRLFRGRTRLPSGLVELPELLARYEEAAGWAVPPRAFHFWSVHESVYTAVTMVRAAAIFAAGETHDVRYAALGYQSHHGLRHVLDYLEAARAGGPPR